MKPPKTKTINLMLLDGGLGDCIAALSPISYILSNYPWITPICWMPDFLVEFARHVLPRHANVKGFSQMRGSYDPAKTTKTTQWDGVISPMKIHCIDYAFLKLCDESPSIDHKNYLQIKYNPSEYANVPFFCPNKYIVLTTGFTADVREWPAAEINKTVKYLVEKKIMPVFLGQTQTKTGVLHTIDSKFKEEIDFSASMNLINKTTLLQAANIMHGAVAVLGVDNGLLHLAGCTNAPIIGGFTTVKPEIRMPIRNNMLGYKFYPVVPDESLACSFCQQKTNFLYGHDYRNCLYKGAKKNLCTTQMTADKFIEQLKFVIG